MKKPIKKLFAGLLLLAFITVAALTPKAAARAAEPNYTVRGLVINYPANQSPVAGVQVHIECQSHIIVTTATTDSTGHFSVEVSPSLCPLGADLMTLASFGGLSGGTRTHMMEDNDILLQLGVEFNAPEYSWLPGVAAAGAGIGGVALARRRNTPRQYF